MSKEEKNIETSPIEDLSVKSEKVEIVDQEDIIEIEGSSDEDIAKSKSIFKNSIFTDDQIDKMSSEFLPVSQFFSLSYEVLKTNLWKAFIRPSVYALGGIISLGVLGGIIFAMLATSLGNNGMLIGAFVLLIVYILMIVVGVNFGIRSLLVLKDPNHEFLSKNYAVSKYFWPLVSVAVLTNIITYGLGFFSAVPFIGWLLGIAVSVLAAMFLPNSIFMTVFENQKPLENLEKSYELSKNRFKDLLPRTILITLTPWIFAIVVGIFALILFLVFGLLFGITLNSGLNTGFDTSSIIPLIIGGIVALVIFVAIGVLFSMFYSSLIITNYANLRLSPKPNKNEKFYNEYKSKLPAYAIVFIIVASLVLGGIGSASSANQRSEIINQFVESIE